MDIRVRKFYLKVSIRIPDYEIFLENNKDLCLKIIKTRQIFKL